MSSFALPRSILSLAVFLSAFLLPPSSFGQGSLTPPGPPAPTMKTLDQLDGKLDQTNAKVDQANTKLDQANGKLDQIEPRKPISTLPFTISAAGIYYLTKNITTTGDGIIIRADDVVVDLGGFTLTGDNGVSDFGVLIDTQSRVIVHNGTVRNFGAGVRLEGGTTDAVVEDMIVIGNGFGILGASNAASLSLVRSVIRRVRAIANTNDGIFIGNGTPNTTITQNIVDQCEASGNTGAGIRVFPPGNLIVRCVASGNSPNYNIGINNRMGAIVAPAVNATTINGSAGGPGSGTSDPFANLSF